MTPIAAPSNATAATTPRRGSPRVRTSANARIRRVTDSDWAEKTRKPPVSSATSASMSRFTR